MAVWVWRFPKLTTPEADRALTYRYYLAVWEPLHSYLPWDLGEVCGSLADVSSAPVIWIEQNP